MFVALVAVVLVTAVANLVAAGTDLARLQWTLDTMTRYGVPHSWIVPLGLAKVAGAVGLVAGIIVPAVGVAAAIGLILYFVGAVGTLVRMGDFRQLGYPGLYLVLAGASLGLMVAVA